MALKQSEYTLENYRAICAAIADGAVRVKYTDKEIEYRDLDDMIKIKNMIKKELGLCSKPSGTKKGLFGGRRLTARHDKGLC
jgi:hypothetical protein